jgi:integrase
MAYTEIRGGVIRVRWKLATGKYSGGVSVNEETGEPFASEEEALQYGRDQETLIRLKIRQDKERPPTFAEFATAWYAGQALVPSTLAKYRSLLKNHLLHVFGDRPLTVEAFPAHEMDPWEQSIVRAGYEPSTAAGARNLLVNILNDAVPRYLEFNPAVRRRGKGRKGLRRVEAAKAERKVWPNPLEAVLVAERCAILAGHDDVFLQMVTLAWTGVRWGEVLAIQPDKLLPGQLLDVDQKLYELKGFYLQYPKDGSVRVLDVPPFLWRLLQAQAERARMCPCRGRDERLPPVDGDAVVEWCPGKRYLFLTPEGAHWQRGNFGGRVMRPAADGRWPERKGTRQQSARPVLVDVAQYGPRPDRGRRRVRPVSWPWPDAVTGQEFHPPTGRGRPDWLSWPESERPHLASWLAVREGLTPHGLRHGHQTWMDDAGIKKALKVERMGHEDMTMPGLYGHVTAGMRTELVDMLQALWENAIAERFKIWPASPIPALDAELARWREGTASKVVTAIAPRNGRSRTG